MSQEISSGKLKILEEMIFIKRSNLKRKSRRPYLKLIRHEKDSKSGKFIAEFVSSPSEAPRFSINNFKPQDEVSRIYELTGIRFRAETHMVGNDGKIYDNVYTEKENS